MGLKVSKTDFNEHDLEILHKLSKKPKEEITFWYEHFIRENPSGKLNQEQFVFYYKQFRKGENVEEIAKHCFNAFDLDKNHFVDFGEFLIAYVATTSEGNVLEKLKYAFSVYDQDNNAFLDENEIRSVLHGMFRLLNMDEKTVKIDDCMKNIMSSLDENQDKKITIGEFIIGVMHDPVLQTLLSPFPLNMNQ